MFPNAFATAEARIISLMESYVTCGMIYESYSRMCRMIRRVSDAYGMDYAEAFAHYRSEAEMNCA